MDKLTATLSSRVSLSGNISSKSNVQGSFSQSIVSSAVNLFNSYLEFPRIGSASKLYLDLTDNSIYRWDETELRYICIGRNYDEIKFITGGNSRV